MRAGDFHGAFCCIAAPMGASMNRIVYIVGLVVIIIAILSFFGLR